MPTERPLFWKAFDAVEEQVAPRLEQAVRSSRFLEAVGLAARAQARLRRDAERRSRRVWHLLNLPAGSDVSHLKHQIARLDRELRRVNAALEAAVDRQDRPEEVPPDADDPQRAVGRPAGAGRGARARPARDRAQRPPGP
jgi:hypothetical protein